MFFRRRRQAGQRSAIVAGIVFAYLASVGPAAATIIYCIGDSHSGFERVSSGERGCASCCHELLEGSAHGQPESSECTDVALTAEQALRAGISADRQDAAPAVSPELLPARIFDRTVSHRFLPALRGESPPGAHALVERRSIVLLI